MKRRWSELSSGQQTLILVGASTELALTATALVDLIRRPADQVHGRKLWWGMAIFVQPVGPIAYLVSHRR